MSLTEIVADLQIRLAAAESKIDELEAELAKATGEDHSADPHEECADREREQRARAEKAEKQVEGLKRIIETAPTPGSLVAENERLKARLAAHHKGNPHGGCFVCEPAPAIEGHEREADS